MRFRGSHAALAAAFVCTSLTMPASAIADWPIYGHDLANTRDAGSAGPAPEQVPSLSRAWTFESSTGDFTGTPVVADGVLVAGDYGGVAYALDPATGKRLWSRNLGAPINGSAAIDPDAPGGAAAYVPVAQSGSPRLVALSLDDGTVLWDRILTKQPNASVFGSPVYWNGTVYIGTSGPNTDDSTARGSMVALDQRSGRLRWQTFMAPPGRDGVAVFSTPAIDTATGRLYFGTGNNYHPPTTDMEDSIVAMDASTGRVVGHFQALSGDSFSGGDNPAGPDFDFGASANLFAGPNGERLVGEGQKSGTYWALDRATMRPVWSRSVGPGGPLGGILGSTAYDGTRIYGADTLDGQVFALGRGGALQWQSLDPGVLHVGPAAIAHGVLYTLDPNGALNARDPATGMFLAKLPLDGPALGGVSAVGGAVFVSIGTGPLPEPAPQNDSPGSIVAYGDTTGLARRAQPGGSKRRGRQRLKVRPRRVPAHRRVRLRFRVTSHSRPVAHASIRVGRRLLHTRRNGRARVRIRFTRKGRHVVRTRHVGYRLGRARIRVTSRARR